MDRILGLTRYVVLIGVVGLLLAAFAGFILALTETGELVWHVFTHIGDPNLEVQEVSFIKLVDGFLISTGLLIFALGLYEIFFHQLDLPEALKFTTIGQLKTSLANIIALTLAVTFLTLVQEHADTQSVLWQGIAIAAVIAVLVFFSRGGDKGH
jgi:uncharacterized membrane protein YqhA